MQQMTDLRLLDMRGVCKATSLSRTQINRLRAQGQFPKGVKLGERRIAFVASEVRDWIKARLDLRDQIEGAC
jgi:prophage regulatory protein